VKRRDGKSYYLLSAVGLFQAGLTAGFGMTAYDRA